MITSSWFPLDCIEQPLLDVTPSAHTLVLPRFILDEIERVLLDPRLQARYEITAGEAARFTERLGDD